MNSESADARFWRHVRIGGSATGCWTWTGPTNGHGYGRMRLTSQAKEYAHRFSYERTWGDLEPGQVVMHTCDNPSCVRPAHLRAGTMSDNSIDMHQKGRWALTKKPGREKTHCPHGHEYDAANTYYSPQGWRRCRACHRITQNARTKRVSA